MVLICQILDPQPANPAPNWPSYLTVKLTKSYDTDPASVRNAFNAKDVQFRQTVLEAAHGDLARRFHDVLVEYFRVDDSALNRYRSPNEAQLNKSVV